MKNFPAAIVLLLPLAAGAQDGMMMMSGALGPQSMTQEASGTSWQPEASPMEGLHGMSGESMWMVHGFADFVYDRQGGARGAEETYGPSMLMVMGQTPAGPGTLGARAMLSLDPLMGSSGYPLLFQTGETADGVTPLVDRQHPHDFFMEMAGTYSVPVGEGSVFAYAGLPGEPALGPPTFMHRASGQVSPEAPLTHHWLDSTHVTFGVLTLGATTARWKFDASVFNGREPDQNRWNLETRQFDSVSGRVTFNPSEAWSLQLSHGYLAEPEQLEPGVAVHRTTASVAQTVPIDGGHWASTFAVGINHAEGENHPGFLLETARVAGANTVFARADWLRTHELAPSGDAVSVGKLSLGAARDVWRAGLFGFSVGGLVSAYRVPSEVQPFYGEHPLSAMVFVRTTLAGGGT